MVAINKFQWANMSSNYLITGSGKLSFRLTNMWTDYQMRFANLIFVTNFRLFQNGTSYPILVAVSNNVNFENPTQPLQGHIALTNDPSQMRHV